MASKILEDLLRARGFVDLASREAFLHPDYEKFSHNPGLLPDMQVAVERIVEAQQKRQKVVIYGDYDIDGLTATTILLDALTTMGLQINTFIPNRFVDGYGLSEQAIETLAKQGAELIITVDCGSLSHKEIEFANSLGLEVIVTDHHSVAETMPAAVATINPKRTDHAYPFIDLAGCGVAFKLVQALQKVLPGLSQGQEKWLLDLVALGTVCDVVSLKDENRANVYWGLQVLAKTRRPGIKALAAIAGLKMEALNARSLGFVIGPHLNASGRLETAKLSLDLLTTKDSLEAIEIAYKLRDMNIARRAEQDRIVKEATILASQFENDPVLVLSHPTWSHGIIGIVAAKMLEAFQKPTFVLQELGEESKGSARSYGDFSAVEGIRASMDWLTKGGGHKLAAGVTLPTKNIDNFRQAMNDFYRSLNLINQVKHLEPVADVVLNSLEGIDQTLVDELKLLEPFGHGNQEPIFQLQHAVVVGRREMGSDKQHLKLHIKDADGRLFALMGFNQCQKVTVQPGDTVNLWFTLIENEWRGNKSVEGRLNKVEIVL